MGSANGCCKNPNVDNIVVKDPNGPPNGVNHPQNNPSGHGGYGSAWGDPKGGPTMVTQQQNWPEVGHGGRNVAGNGVLMSSHPPPPAEISRETNRMAPPHPEHRKTGGGGSRSHHVEEQPTTTTTTSHSTSKAIGSVLFMFMNTFSQQPRELLIALGGGNQLVRPASFKLEDSETVKTATITQIAEVDVESDVLNSGLNVPEEVPLTRNIRNRRGSSMRMSNSTGSSVLIPPDVHNAAVSRIINSLNMFPRNPVSSSMSRDSA